MDVLFCTNLVVINNPRFRKEDSRLSKGLFDSQYLPGTILGPLAAAERGPLPYLTWLGVALQETTAISSSSWPWTRRVLEEAAVSDWRRPVRLCTKRRAWVDIGPWPPPAPYPPDTTPPPTSPTTFSRHKLLVFL